MTTSCATRSQVKLLHLVSVVTDEFCQTIWLTFVTMDMEFASLDPNPAATALKRDLSNIILWHERTSPRSLQRTIGPSEIGNPCDRRIAYRIVGTQVTNTHSDPWPAIVGTAIHTWLEGAITRYQAKHKISDWLTELAVQPDPLVRGRSDAFHVPTCTVVDFKTTNAETMRKLRKGEKPSEGYLTQINVYGFGHEKAGREVKNVALVYYPRSGWLNDAFVWVAPYDRSVATRAIDRLYRIGFQLLDLDIEAHPEHFADIPASPGDGCVWCPMFQREMASDRLGDQPRASAKGCPGH